MNGDVLLRGCIDELRPYLLGRIGIFRFEMDINGVAGHSVFQDEIIRIGHTNSIENAARHYLADCRCAADRQGLGAVAEHRIIATESQLTEE